MCELRVLLCGCDCEKMHVIRYWVTVDVRVVCCDGNCSPWFVGSGVLWEMESRMDSGADMTHAYLVHLLKKVKWPLCKYIY